MKNPFHSKKDLLDTIGLGKIRTEEQFFASKSLGKDIKFVVFLPPGYLGIKKYPLLFWNDGQDLKAVDFKATTENLLSQGRIKRFIGIGVYPQNRMQEYGTTGIPDYKNRGSDAGAYAEFITRELLPFLEEKYSVKSPGKHVFAGFSLGGLSAFDITWSHPKIFAKVGVFSGSFWWRSKPVQDHDPDADRIVIDILSKSRHREGLKFWLQTGTLDEMEDRNNNGIIDSIDDTTDVIRALEKLGYQSGKDIKYVEVINGHHNPQTWRKILPDFLQWAFGG
ncbi:MAG: alpha/beta hydrolase-fold protein [Saprospiraceae bacterium]